MTLNEASKAHFKLRAKLGRLKRTLRSIRYRGNAFECPEGIKFVETDVESGLLSTLSCPHRELIAITDRLAPNFECYNHGNLPDSNDWIEGSPYPILQSAVVASQRTPPSKEFLLPQLTSKSTRVDVDSRGRHALLNDLR